MNNSEAEDAIGLQGTLAGKVVSVCLKRTPTTRALKRAESALTNATTHHNEIF
jgi:hypothetical protein